MSPKNLNIYQKERQYMFDKESLKKLQDAIEITEIMYEELNKKVEHAGFGNFEAICPFCKEPNRSFIFNDRYQCYHCYECKAYGDVIDYFMTAKKMTFEEACLYLAKKYDVELKKTPKKERMIK